MVGHALGEATGTAGKKKKRKKNDVSDRDVVVMGSGNLGLVYLMEERRRLTLEEMNERHPDLIPALRSHPHVGWLLVRSSEHGPVVLGGNGTHYLADGRVEGEDPLARVLAERAAAPAPHRRLRARRRHHGRQLLRPGARDRVRVRGADLVPRRHRRPADAAVHPPPVGAGGAGRRDRGRGLGARDPGRLAARAQRGRGAADRRVAEQLFAHVLVYAAAAAASPLVLTATFVVIRSDRPRTNGIAFLVGFLLGTALACGVGFSSARRRSRRLDKHGALGQSSR